METRFLECRADGRVLTGPALVYGDVANLGGGRRETFGPQPFGDVGALDVIANIQHNRQRPIARTGGGGLELLDSKDRLTVRADLPKTTDADDALELVRTGVLRGWSIEFDPRAEQEQARMRRIVTAILGGLALVDRPAYGLSVPELRAEVRQEGDGVAGSFFYDTDTTIADTGRRRKQRVKAGAFDFALKAPDREITLLLGSPDKPLASKTAGTLQLTDTLTALSFFVPRVPRTSYGLDFMELLRGGSVVFGLVPFFLVPPMDGADGEEEEPGNPGVFRHLVFSAVLTALAIQYRAPRGNPGQILSRADETTGQPYGMDAEPSGLVIPKRRRRLWL